MARLHLRQNELREWTRTLTDVDLRREMQMHEARITLVRAAIGSGKRYIDEGYVREIGDALQSEARRRCR